VVNGWALLQGSIEAYNQQGFKNAKYIFKI
jgi:hypothetical protein